MFIKVLQTIVTQEVEPKCPYKLEPNLNNAIKTEHKRELLPNTEQSKYDVLYGDELPGPSE
tara:strand:- start:184 stop:366 length:183 start_codon:yes stop_codon:yes gene_type:complete